MTPTSVGFAAALATVVVVGSAVEALSPQNEAAKMGF